ncbi:MAG: glycosyltransferase family 2 protein [Candidatus Helarchaeota archaeon]|nr:glycosyltransferase family 2 protein [Candidatus Helarchaeota archaeon]
MSKIRYLIYGSIIVGIFAIIHWIFPRDWSRWLQRVDNLHFETPGFKILFGFCIAFFIAFVLLYGTAFMASFGKTSYPEGSDTFTPPISVIIPALNEENVIGNTLETFHKSKYPKENLELVVVASGSTDKTVEICESYQEHLNIQIITDPLPKKGKPAALNLGLKNATHDFFCVYDADIQIQDDTLKYLVRHLYNPEVDVTIGPVAIQNWNVNKLTKAIAIEFSYMSGAGLYFEIRNRLGRNLWIFGRNYCIRRKVIEEVGGWNEDALAEDMHLSVQLAMLKKKVVHAPHAFASEQAPTDWETYKHQRRRWVGGYKQGLDAAMELDKRAVLLRNFGMLHFGHINNFAVGALITALIFGFIVRDFYVMLVCLVIFFFTFGMSINGLRKYGYRRFRLLLYYLVFFITNLYMFIVQFKNLKDIEWEKTEK